jgi:hypothetical protein
MLIFDLIFVLDYNHSSSGILLRVISQLLGFSPLSFALASFLTMFPFVALTIHVGYIMSPAKDTTCYLLLQTPLDIPRIDQITPC